MLHLAIFQIFWQSAKSASVYKANPHVNTTNYGLHSFSYHASKLWNLLPGNACVSTSLAAFKIALKTVQLDNECCSFCDQC